MPSTTLTIVRHGDTFAPGETPRRIGARTDIPLVASGIAQGEALGRWFARAGLRFDRVLASPLRRTTETAALILARQPAPPPPVEPADWLAEIEHGPDEGRTDAAIVARIGRAALDAWDRDAIAPDGWRVEGERRQAAWAALYAAVAARPAGDILIVTSNGAARFALTARAEVEAAARTLPSLKMRTGAWGALRVDAASVTLQRWNERPA